MSAKLRDSESYCFLRAVHFLGGFLGFLVNDCVVSKVEHKVSGAEGDSLAVNICFKSYATDQR